jgi:predicted transcriptional regulator
MSTMTIELNPLLEEKLTRLAHDTNRNRSALATEAVQAYVDRQLEIIAGINRGIADLQSGRVIPHEQAMNEIDALIEQASA